MFDVETQRSRQIESVTEQDPIWIFKSFITRRGIRKVTAEQAKQLDAVALDAQLDTLQSKVFPNTLAFDDELAIACIVAQLLEREKLLEQTKETDDENA
jgi:hypothetical protein